MKISKDYLKKPKRDPHLHSPDHVLADELVNKLGDSQHFGFYLKTALNTDHNVLRKIAGQVTEGSSSNPGALFAFLVKKYKRERDISQGYSLWLLPEPGTTTLLEQAINSLAQTFDAPVFKPHVTLLGGLAEGDTNVFKKLSDLTIFTVNSKSPRNGDGFWSAIHLPIIKNKEMLAARRVAKKAFSVTTNDKFEPHLSILYANQPEEKRLAAVKAALPNPPHQITFTQLALVKTTGRIEEFEFIKTIDLKALPLPKSR